MAVQNITIHKETPPERCEICHQADQFDPQTQECRRCSSLPVQASIEGRMKTRKWAPVYPDMGVRPSARATLAMFLGVAALVPGVCLGPVGLMLGALGAVLGRMELNRIKKSPASHESEIFAMVGFYIGITGSIISLLLMLAYCQGFVH